MSYVTTVEWLSNNASYRQYQLNYMIQDAMAAIMANGPLQMT